MPSLGSQSQYPGQPTTWAGGIVPRSGHCRVVRRLDRVVRLNLGLPFPVGHAGSQPKVFTTPRFLGQFAIVGVTRNSTGSALGGCTVELFKNDATDTFLQVTTSDGSGNYQFVVSDNATTYWVRAYLPGSPDVFGTTLNTLTAVVR